ncbi:MAG: hypothetical protein FWF67_01225 [Fibromonadales bacterium]|nr:hypothetical protein [Fibromonadales bacterium]
MFSKQEPEELPSWSIKKQKAYKISRILWIAQIVIALLASILLIVLIVSAN